MQYLELTCYPKDGAWGEWADFSRLENVWKLDPAEWGDCDARFKNGPYNSSHMSEQELSALDIVLDEDDIPRADSLVQRYEECANPLLGTSEEVWAESVRDGWDEGWRNSQKATLALCPDHPDAERISEMLVATAESDASIPEPVYIRPGTYKVGSDVQPGRYTVESDDPMDGCYWERTDAQGNIIDNQFLTSGFRIEVTIQPTDYSFTTASCDPFELQ